MFLHILLVLKILIICNSRLDHLLIAHFPVHFTLVTSCVTGTIDLHVPYSNAILQSMHVSSNAVRLALRAVILRITFMLMSSLAMGLVHSEHLNFSTMKSLNFSVLATTSLLIISKTETVSRGKVLLLIRA